MQKRKQLFERIPLDQVPRFKPQDHSEPARAALSVITNNVRKQAPRLTHGIRRQEEDHPAGLWINTEMFRKHQNRTPQIVLHDPLASVNNPYLALADKPLANSRRNHRRK